LTLPLWKRQNSPLFSTGYHQAGQRARCGHHFYWVCPRPA
jgi:hypothetical protein